LRFSFSDPYTQHTIKELSVFVKDGTHGSHKDCANGIPLLSAKDIHDGIIDLSNDPRKISESDYCSIYKKHKPERDDILITIVGTIGRTAIIPDRSNDFAFQRSVGWIRPNKSMYPLYFNYLLQSKTVQNNIVSKTNTSAQGGIYLGELEKIVVSIPQLDEQRKIAAILSTIDKQIQTQNKIINKLESLKNQINNNFFSSLKTQVLFKSIYTKAGEGGTPDTKKESYYKNGVIPFIKIDDLYSKYIIEAKSFITYDGLKHSSAWIIPSNCILLSNGATIGETAINTIPVATKQGILGIIPKENLNNEFLYYLFKTNTFKKRLKKITTKGTMDAAYLKDIDRLLVPNCPIEMQKNYINKINKIEEKILNEKKLLQLYAVQKKYLMKNLFI